MIEDGTYTNLHGVRTRFEPPTGYFVGAGNLYTGTDTEIVELLAGGVREGELYGVWTDAATGQTYLDFTDYVPYREIAEARAKRSGELAIWDIERDTEIRLDN